MTTLRSASGVGDRPATAELQLGLTVADPAVAGAVLSDCGTYRYRLWRRWDDTAPMIHFIMLNPSTADAEQDDPTIRRCIGFAKSWGYGSLMVVNVYALRSTDPDALAKVDDPFGPMNGAYLYDALQAPLAIAAWGAHPGATRRFRRYFSEQSFWVQQRARLKALGLTKDGHPRHPLYVRGDAQLIDYAGGVNA